MKNKLMFLSLLLCFGCHTALAENSKLKNILNEINNPKSDTVLIAAHRGGYAKDYEDKAPENSVANIMNAVNKGYEVYETDLQRTKDGVFVIVHDGTIKRETNGTGKVKDLTLKELKQFRKKYRNGRISEEAVATFEEMLEHGKNRIMFKVDMKRGVKEHFKEVVSLVKKHGMMDSVIFRVRYRDVGFYSKYIEEGDPYSKNLLMFMVSTEDQVDSIIKKFNPMIIQVNLDRKNPTPPETLKLIKYAVSKGLLVQVHSEGNEEDWNKLISAGVRMFHSRKPAKLQKYLRSINKLYQPDFTQHQKP